MAAALVGLWTADSIRERSLFSLTLTPGWPLVGVSDVVVGSIEALTGSVSTASATLPMNSSIASCE